LWQRHLNQQGQPQLLVSALGAASASADPIYKHLEKAQAQRESLEQARLIYVACTRAKRHLFLLAEVKPGSEAGQNQAPSKTSILGSLWPGVETLWPVAEVADPPAEQEAAETPSLKLAPLHRLPLDWAAPPWPRETLLQAYVPPFDYKNQAQSPFAPGCDLPRAIGTLVHQALSAMAEQGMSRWQQHWPGSNPAWPAQLLRLGLPRHLVPAAIKGAQELIAIALADPFLHTRLNQPERCQAEQTWWQLAEDGESLQQVRPDLLWHSEEGAVWLIDYKTARPQVGQELEEFIQAEKTSYHKTLQQYAQALRASGLQRLKVGLYFVALGRWCEYDDLSG
ncbi:MAG TPA: PD-(D/E)XK nuclease family protein, partial [Cellvibrionaceae bacterium]|nr:PD-(D/E)XK nuclease family protein [Cellvibrionaceae bacterium]